MIVTNFHSSSLSSASSTQTASSNNCRPPVSGKCEHESTKTLYGPRSTSLILALRAAVCCPAESVLCILIQYKVGVQFFLVKQKTRGASRALDDHWTSTQSNAFVRQNLNSSVESQFFSTSAFYYLVDVRKVGARRRRRVAGNCPSTYNIQPGNCFKHSKEKRRMLCTQCPHTSEIVLVAECAN